MRVDFGTKLALGTYGVFNRREPEPSSSSSMERKTERFPSTAATCKSRSSGCADGAVAWLLLLASSGDRLVGLRLSRFSVFAFFRSEDLRNSIVETSAAASPSPTPQLSGDRGRFDIVDTILCGVWSSTVPDSGSGSADISARMRGVSSIASGIQNNCGEALVL